MRRILQISTALFLVLLVPGAGGEAALSAQEPTVPDWMQVDHDAQRVTMQVIAGLTDDINGWNFNGYGRGNAEIIVPEGYEIVIEFTNQETGNPHSLGIGEAMTSYPPNLSGDPVFEGAITSGATAKVRATQTGESETISFTADTAGEYAMICYIPMHAAMGMWTWFTVSADGAVGLIEST